MKRSRPWVAFAWISWTHNSNRRAAPRWDASNLLIAFYLVFDPPQWNRRGGVCNPPRHSQYGERRNMPRPD